MERAHCVIVRAGSWLTNHTGALIIGLAVVWMALTPRPAWGQSSWPSYPNNTAISVTSGGNVGIATTSPQHALGFGYGGLTSDGSSGLGLMSGVYFNAGWKYLNSSAKPATIQLQTDGSTVFANGNVAGAPGGTVTGYGTSMVITSAGNVGIGTTNPQYKLAVNGTIGAKDVIVTNTGWSSPGGRCQAVPVS